MPLNAEQAGMGESRLIAKAQRGFTMVEMITVMVLVGILAAVALPRFFNNTVFEARAAADQVKSSLRYAQKVAIASRGLVTVNFTAGADSDCGAEVAGGVLACVIKDSVALSGASSVVFDAIGRPVPNVPTTVTVGATNISIAAETGYVH